MFTKPILADVFRHMEWADAEVWRAVLASEAACDDAVLRGLLRHLHVVQRAFLSVWQAEPPVFPDASQFPSIGDLHAWAAPYYAAASAHLERIDEAALDAPITMPWAAELAAALGRQPCDPTMGESMFQVTSHSTYHRGQINARLRAVGGEPPLVDYIAWIWFGRPVAMSAARP